MKFSIPLVLCSILSGMPLAASAQNANSDQVQTDPAVAASSSNPETAKAVDAERADPFCLRSTGSLIAASENERAQRQGKPQTACAPASGRSYSQDDIRNTGQMSLADALRSLDPAIR